MKIEKNIEFEFNGNRLMAVNGQTIAEALLSNGIMSFRKTLKKQNRGVFCGMGICYECRAIVNGVPNVRTCMTQITPNCRVETQDDASLKVNPYK